MRKYFGYIRVSTAKQGELGVSLQEQRDAISRYAQRNNFEVAEWFEERETAAKLGRPVFKRMMKLLHLRKVNGVIIHKIDRSARNLKDWIDLEELSDKGIEVHFVNESVDLLSRGGRLSADIQAVVAADYIRNLREETRKGFYGRIKQGLYPLPAPLGYLDRGKGNPKEPDPIMAPLVKKAFELYGTGGYNLNTLLEELRRLGFRNRRGNQVTKTGLSNVLNNPFYIGIIKLRSTGEIFEGIHEPLISKSLFDRVQGILKGKTNTKSRRNDFLFRRMLVCRSCGFTLIGERQKGHIYYRCHTQGCPTKGIREEAADEDVLCGLLPLQLNEQEISYLENKLGVLKAEWGSQKDREIDSLKLRLGQLKDRQSHLTDAYIDKMIEKEVFEERKAALVAERKDLEEALAKLEGNGASIPDRLGEILELTKAAYLQYKLGLPEEKRDLLKTVTSNREVVGKNVELTLSAPFNEVANRLKTSNSAPYRYRPRTLDQMVKHLWKFFESNPNVRIALPSMASLEDSAGERIGKNGELAA